MYSSPSHRCKRQMPLRLSLVILLPIFLVYNAFGRDTASALKEIQLPSIAKGKLQLSAVVAALFTKSDDIIELDLSFSGHSIHETFRRSISLYVIESEPDCLLIDEAHDSNEDTLYAYELRGGRLHRLTINHPSDDDHIHEHFKVLTVSGRAIQCLESEYAGWGPSRKRDITIEFSADRIACKRASWTKDE